MSERLVCPKCRTELDAWKQPHLAADVLIEDAAGRVLLIRRRNPPHGWAIPGGFVDYGETLETAAMREMLEETGLDVELLSQFHTYSDPARDPRHHTVTIVFHGRRRDEAAPPIAGDDALEARFFALEELPAPLVFDHPRVLDDFRRRRERGGLSERL